MRKTTLILIALTICLSVKAQLKPRKIKSKSDYTHSATGFNFPLRIEHFKRYEIYAFDRKKKNIAATYKSADLKTSFTIYIYPAQEATEDRLRNEYLESMQSIANISDKGVHAHQIDVSYKNEDYKVNGFKADFKGLDKKSSLSIYECGEWFFKFRISSESLDTSRMLQTEQEILNIYKPTRLVKLSKLNPKADISFAKTAFIDSLMLGSAMGSAYKKIEWAFENVDSLERASGFPGLYLDMHIASLKEFVKFEEKHPDFGKTKPTEEYLAELNSIIDSGFLGEFIMEQFDMVMIVPESYEFDFEGYEQWKANNPISINLNERFYVIWFGY